MRSLRVVTWNVLHRVHGLNWREAPVLAHPEEEPRARGVTEAVRAWLGGDVDVVCLQEVSGDQVERLRAAARSVPGGAEVFTHAYPRVPRLRSAGAPGVEDATEHLVVIVKRRGARVRDAQTFESDPGKGLLAVDVVDAGTIVDTHVSFGERRGAQLALVAETAREAMHGAVVVGDFNATSAEVREALGEGFDVTALAGVTRIATDAHDGKTIDHVAVLRGRIAFAKILDGGGLSDHHPVLADVLLGEAD